MATIGKRVIFAGPADGADSKPQLVEGVAVGASILPGTLLERSASGLDTSTSAATVFGVEFIVADVNALQSKTVDDAWTQNENMVGIRPRGDEFVNVIVASGETISARDVPLSRNGAGKLQVAATGGTEEIVAFSDEAPGALASDTLVRVRPA